MSEQIDVAAPARHRVRVRIFVDFWNFSLELRRKEDAFRIDWKPIGNLFTQEAGKLAEPSALIIYEGMHVYGSYDPAKPADAKFKNWFTTWLDKQAGVHAVMVPRQRKKGYPKCPECHNEATHCSSCGVDMRGTEEKGVDTNIVKDMISLAWQGAYDVALLVSADRDFVPVAEFLQSKGIKVIHGSFPPKGSELSQKCWGNIDIGALKEQYRVKAPAA